MDDAPVDWTRTILLFAFVFITFVNWLVTRLRERAAERRMRKEEQAAEAEARTVESPQPHRTLRERERTAPSHRPASTEPSSPPPQPTKAEAELRKFFEALGLPVEESEDEAVRERRRRAEAEEEAEARAARQAREEAEARRRSEARERQRRPPPGSSPATEPPPIPQRAKAAADRTITRITRSAAPSPIEAGDLALRRTRRPGAALEVTGGSRKRNRERQADLRRLLQSPQTLRQAVLLREILDPPRGLQSQDSLTKL